MSSNPKLKQNKTKQINKTTNRKGYQDIKVIKTPNRMSNNISNGNGKGKGENPTIVDEELNLNNFIGEYPDNVFKLFSRLIYNTNDTFEFDTIKAPNPEVKYESKVSGYRLRGIIYYLLFLINPHGEYFLLRELVDNNINITFSFKFKDDEINLYSGWHIFIVKNGMEIAREKIENQVDITVNHKWSPISREYVLDGISKAINLPDNPFLSPSFRNIPGKNGVTIPNKELLKNCKGLPFNRNGNIFQFLKFYNDPKKYVNVLTNGTSDNKIVVTLKVRVKGYTFEYNFKVPSNATHLYVKHYGTFRPVKVEVEYKGQIYKRECEIIPLNEDMTMEDVELFVPVNSCASKIPGELSLRDDEVEIFNTVLNFPTSEKYLLVFKNGIYNVDVYLNNDEHKDKMLITRLQSGKVFPFFEDKPLKNINNRI